MENSLGRLFTITSFGESHGRCVGIVVDGCPAGLAITEEEIQREVDKRKPEANISTKRMDMPFSESAPARFMQVVVFPTPPFWFANEMT